MELDSILKYQAIDLELHKIKKEMQTNENCRIAEEAKRQFNEMKTAVAKNENIAAKVYGGYEESLKHYEETLKKAEELMEKLDDQSISEEDADKIAENLEAIKLRLGEIADFIANIKKKGEEAVREFSAAQKSGHELKNKYSQARDEMKKLEERYKPQIARLQQELAEARKSVDDELFATYEKVTQEIGFPAFVQVYEADGNTMNCSLCGYSLSLNTQSELRDRGYCVCEKCRRIIYGRKK